MDKYRIINQRMIDLKFYTQKELSELCGFNVTQNSIKALKRRSLIKQYGENYQTTQADLFTAANEAKAICSNNNIGE